MKGEAPATGFPVRMGLALRAARGNYLWKEIRSVAESGFRHCLFQANYFIALFEFATFLKQLDSFEPF